MKNDFVWLLAVFIGSRAVAFAEAPALTKDTLHSVSQLTSLAEKRSPQLRSLASEAEAAAHAARQAADISGPSLDLSVGRRKEGSATGPTMEIGLAQPFSFGKRGLRGGIAQAAADAARSDAEAARIDLRLRVTEAAMEYATLRRIVDFTRHRQKRFSVIQEFLDGRVFASPQKRAERDIVRNKLRNINAETAAAEARLQGVETALRLLTGLAEPGRLEIDVPWFRGTRAVDGDSLSDLALERNPVLRRQALAVESSALERRLARRNRLPDARLTGSFDRADATDTETNAAVGVGLDFESWNANRNGVRSALARETAEAARLEQERTRIRADAGRVLADYRAACRTAAQYPESLMREIGEERDRAEAGFRKGQVDLLTFLELENATAETVIRALDAQTRLIKTAEEIFRLSNDDSLVDQLSTF